MDSDRGATAAYRGYRHQALYVLARVFGADDGKLVFQPEGIEDLAVFEGERLVEVCQVKALQEPLALSHLHPATDDSFFGRAAARVARGETAELRLVSFGPIGSELAAASRGDIDARRALVQKLAAKGFQPDVATGLVGRLIVEGASEVDLRGRLIDRFRTSLLGTDPTAAFDLLSFWIYLKSEERARLTGADARERVERVASALADIGARRMEWFTTIEPLVDPRHNSHERRKLREEFDRGIAVRYEHIAAGLAVPRPSQIARIEDGFSRHRVVVIHAPSGQGKTALAYSYLQGLPDIWRFRVKAIEDRHHALTIARALLGHAHALQVPLFVHVDVSPRDLDWPVLAAELAADPFMRLLVTIREEDWRRTRALFEFEFSDIALTLEESEARQIHGQLKEAHRDVQPTFEAAWSGFRRGGPLLEFMHFLTQGALLRDRLASQVSRLRDEVRGGRCHPDELSLLRVVSVATAYEAKIAIGPLLEALVLPDPQRTLELLEQEYLIRRSDKAGFVEGLHPVRSNILSDLLCDADITPWQSVALMALEIVDEADLETFLLHSFAYRPSEDRDSLLEGLARLHPRTWTGFGGVVRALVWRGLADYAEACRPLIEDVNETSPGLWWILLDADIADASPAAVERLWATLSSMSKGGADNAATAKALRSRQPPKADVWIPLRRWLAKDRNPPAQPQTDRDCEAIGEAVVFADRAGYRLPIANWVPLEVLVTAAHRASIDSVATLSFGLVRATDVGAEWLLLVRQTLLERFRRAYAVVRVIDANGTMKLDFLVGMLNAGATSEGRPKQDGGNSFNSHAVGRIDVLHRLLPDREQYGTQGWGHRVLGIDHDGTVKNIPVENLHPMPLGELNATFHGYVVRWWRQDSWNDYRGALRAKREAIVRMTERISAAIVTYHRRSAGLIAGDIISGDEFVPWEEMLRSKDLLPKPAVDPWGFVSENSSTGTSNLNAKDLEPRGMALIPYRAFARARDRFFSSLENFILQSPHALQWYAVIGRAKGEGAKAKLRAALAGAGIEEGIARLAEINLHESWQQLTDFQSESRRFVEPESSDELEGRERRAFMKLIDAWSVFTHSPGKRVQDVCRYGAEESERSLKAVLRSVQKSLNLGSTDFHWTVERVFASSGHEMLLLTIDAEDAIQAFKNLKDGVTRVSVVLQGLSVRVRKLVQLYWPELAFVILVCGRPLGRDGISVASLVAASPGWKPEWWHFVPKHLSAELVANGRLRPWDLPDFESGRMLATSAAELLALVRHLSDLPVREDLDDLGQGILKEHVDVVARAFASAHSATTNGMVELSNSISARLSDGRSGHLANAATALSGAHDELVKLREGIRSGNLRVKDVLDWCRSAQEMIGLLYVGHLALASDLVANRQ